MRKRLGGGSVPEKRIATEEKGGTRSKNFGLSPLSCSKTSTATPDAEGLRKLNTHKLMPLLQKLAEGYPLILVSDVDKTLAPATDTPQETVLERWVPPALQKISYKGTVALTTGRPFEGEGGILALIARSNGLAPSPLDHSSLYLSCEGGGVSRRPGEQKPWIEERAIPLIPAMKTLTREAQRRFGDIPGLVIEEKETAFTLHGKGIPPELQEDALTRIRNELVPLVLQLDFSWHRGSKGFEIGLTASVLDKGAFTMRLVRSLGGQPVVIAMGDGENDISNLRAVKEMARRGEISAGAFVGVCYPNSPQEIREHADLCLQGTQEAADFLSWLCDQLPN